MSTNCLIIGESGTGKSASLRNVNHEETFLIQALNKILPFKGWRDMYTPCTKEDPDGNLMVTDNADVIVALMKKISESKPHIKTIIIDDFQYVMANEFMRKHSSAKGNEVFGLYNDIGDHAWNICITSGSLRDDLTIIILSHSEQNEKGITKCKTIGKMLDDKVDLAGMFTISLETFVESKSYSFITQNTGHNIAKSPIGMFETDLIPNDLKTVIEKIKEY